MNPARTPWSMDALSELTYLDMVIKESMRLWPVGTMYICMCVCMYVYLTTINNASKYVPCEYIYVMLVYIYVHLYFY